MALRIGFWSALAGTLVLGVGCPGEKDGASKDKSGEDSAGDDTDTPGDPDDADGDGVAREDDCDDEDADVGEAIAWYTDDDDDGYGDASDSETACTAPEGMVADDTDCDDEDEDVNPDAREVCDDDGVDEDCDGDSNDDDDDVRGETWYTDADGDGYGDADDKQSACEAPEGTVEDNTDCDDTREDVNPDAEEVCDDLETDEDCDGVADNDDDDATGTTTYYTDADADGHGDPDAGIDTCDLPDGAVENNTDCDDTREDINPDAEEICDDEDLDEDCDHLSDDDDDSVSDRSTWYLDVDGDGFGDAESGEDACDAPDGTVADDTDCDDEDDGINPDAEEVCDDDDLDEDCDGLSDDEDDSVVGTSTWYPDADEDGYGDSTAGADTCEAPDGAVEDGTDCDDTDDGVHPDATDTCDGVDEDCDGDTDEDTYADAVLIEVEAATVRNIDPDGGGASTLSSLSGASTSGGARSVAVDYDAAKGYFIGRTDERLYKLDLCKASASRVGASGGSAPCGLSMLGDGRVFGVRDDDDTLVKYSTSTGAGTEVGGLTYDGASWDLGYCGSAYDCTTDTFWVYDATNEALLAIDPDTAEITQNIDVGLTGTSVGLEWDPARASLLLGLGSTLYLLDPTTGATTTLGSTAGDDLSWFPACD